MNRTILIAIGLLAALLMAAGIMRYNNHANLASPEVMAARRQLHDKNLDVRRAAINALGLLGDKESITEIRKLKAEGSLHWDAINALTNLGDKECAPDLRNLLDDTSGSAGGSGIIYLIIKLAQTGDKESIPTISKFVKSEDVCTREAAEKALKELGVPESEIEQAKQH